MQFAAIVPEALSKFHRCCILLGVASAGSVGEIGFVDEVVALEEGARLAAADLHGDRFLHAEPWWVANRRLAQIVNDQSDVLKLASLFSCSAALRTPTRWLDGRWHRDLLT